MSTHSLAPDAASRRESARAHDGKFGTQPKAESEIDLEAGAGIAELPAADLSDYTDRMRSIELLNEALEARSLAHLEDSTVLLARAVRAAHPEAVTLELDRDGGVITDLLAFDADENELDISEFKESFDPTAVGIRYDDLMDGIRQGHVRQSALINDHDEINIDTAAGTPTGPEAESAVAGRHVPAAVRDATLRRAQADLERAQTLLQLSEADRSRAAANVLLADWAQAGVAQVEISFGSAGVAGSVVALDESGARVAEEEIRHNPTVTDPVRALRADSALEVLPVTYLHEGAAEQRRARIDLPETS